MHLSTSTLILSLMMLLTTTLALPVSQPADATSLTPAIDADESVGNSWNREKPGNAVEK
ncbi:MAG: hypothetical protein HETSPECPRED_002478 [Heterodermia speciosa]|uniref:Secreted protein n=1 Tax=Heterodermia speciosa TaxID=116794 RepID=A0A8H3J4M9_9LECA|nr:MAG: hypothetical protein HETSPECPRED_002478 [Heterodermia speciosa]